MMNNSLLNSFLNIGACLLLTASCSNLKHRDQSIDQQIQQALEQDRQNQIESTAAQSTAPPPEVTQALLPPLPSALSDTNELDLEPRFDITVNEAPAREFFMGLVQGTSYNMVVHPDVDGVISLTMKNVTLDQVVQTVRDVYGYEFQRQQNGYLISPSGLQSRIFEVDYLNISRQGDSKTRVASGQITESSGGSEQISDPSGNTEGAQNLAAESASSIETVTKTDFWQELESALNAIVSGGEGSSVVTSPQTGVVVVRAMPEELRNVAQFLDVIQGSLHRQVVLEAKILEVMLNDGFQSGINWSALSEAAPNKTLVFGHTGGGQSLNSEGVSEIFGSAGILNPQNLLQVENTVTSAFGGVFSVAASLNDFNAFIELLESQGNVRVLSSPRVSTINNQKAVIKVGTDEFFVTDISSNTVTGTASTSTSDVTLTPFFSGIALDVTPQISKDGQIVLHIHPSIIEVLDQSKIIPLNNSDVTLPLALSNVRESDSVVHTTSGRVVVIGGLMQDKSRYDEASTPVLGDIPGVGNLFKHKRQVATKSELVILLRAQVIDSPQRWSNNLDDTAKRFEKLRR